MITPKQLRGKSLEEICEMVNGLIEALEFYAKHENWELVLMNDLLTVKTKLTKDFEPFGESAEPGLASKLTYYGGRKAREALRRVEGT